MHLNYAALSVQSYYNTYHKYPPFVYVFDQKMTMPQFLEVMSLAILKPNGFTLPANFDTIKSATNINLNTKTGNIGKTELLTLATNVNNSIQTNGRIPNYVTTRLGRMNINDLLNTFTRAIIFYNTNQRLPNTVAMKNTKFI